MSRPSICLASTYIVEAPKEGEYYIGTPPEVGTTVTRWTEYMEISRDTYNLCMDVLNGGDSSVIIDQLCLETILAVPLCEWQGSVEESPRFFVGRTSLNEMREELATIQALINIKGRVMLAH